MGALRSRALDEITHARLTNWGRWHRYNPVGGSAHPLARMMQRPYKSHGVPVDDLDAEKVEYILVSCKFASITGLIAYTVLLTEYVFSGTAVDARREQLSRRLKRPVSRSSYYDQLAASRDWAAGCLRVFASIDVWT